VCDVYVDQNELNGLHAHV